MKRVFLYGATSAIAIACARIWATQGAELVLAARNPDRLRSVADDLTARGATSVTTIVSDANDPLQLQEAVSRAFGTFGEVDLVLIAHGELPDQMHIEDDATAVGKTLNLNAVSTMMLLTLLAPALERQGSGKIGVITSVAGDRGRRSNYIYGSSKAAVSTFCEGLRYRLLPRGVTVTDLRPGLIATPMTQGRPMPQWLVSTPSAIAAAIIHAVETGRHVAYVPGYWRLIMSILKMMPTFLFSKLKL